MLIGQALDLISRYDSLRNPLTSLGDYLAPELISRCLAESGTVTLHKRRLPLEMMVWCIVGMALERKEPLHQIVNRLDIMLPGNRPFVAPSAVIQTRQRLGIEAVRRVFTKTAQLWHNTTPHPHWCGLTLMDKGYYSLGLLNTWSLAGEHRHWMIPLRKGAQYEEIRKLGKGDHHENSAALA